MKKLFFLLLLLPVMLSAQTSDLPTWNMNFSCAKYETGYMSGADYKFEQKEKSEITVVEWDPAHMNFTINSLHSNPATYYARELTASMISSKNNVIEWNIKAETESGMEVKLVWYVFPEVNSAALTVYYLKLGIAYQYSLYKK